jgi:formate--tetrahydrofolate ligase
VIVVTTRAIEYHGGYTDEGGLGNLAKHIENIRLFGLEPVVAINHFTGDKQEDLNKILDFCAGLKAECAVADHYAQGGKGAATLAKAVLRCANQTPARKLKFLYELKDTLPEKIRKVAKQVYGASEVFFDSNAKQDLALLKQTGYGNLPVCIAKTPLSLSDDPHLRGRPRDFRITVNELRISAGAGFVVVICGSILTMPGLPKEPAAMRMKVLPDGRAVGLA